MGKSENLNITILYNNLRDALYEHLITLTNTQENKKSC